MVKAVPDILAQIIERKQKDPALVTPNLERRAQASVAGRRDFIAALESKQPAIIAEIKKASPSQGLIAADFDPASIARAYQNGGAAALSVLTDGPHFQGKLADLETARAAAVLPVLRKDFTLSESDILEAAAHNADAVLLIAAILSEAQLRRYREFAAQYHISAIVEVHDEDELKLAVGSGAEIIGVNNRDLRTFNVSLDTALRMANAIPDNVIKIAESGIRGAADLRRLIDAGYRAFLIGERLMRAGDPAQALKELLA
jgi:indole-3-glycerol phosphate synthase